MIRGGKTRDSELGAILREILMAQAMFNIQLLVQHVKGECNEIADALSRVHMIKSVECKEFLLGQGFNEHVIESSAFVGGGG